MLTEVQPDTSLIVGGRRVTDDVQRALRDVAPAVVIYVAIRMTGLVALLLFGRARGVDGFSRLQMYDARVCWASPSADTTRSVRTTSSA